MSNHVLNANKSSFLVNLFKNKESDYNFNFTSRPNGFRNQVIKRPRTKMISIYGQTVKFDIEKKGLLSHCVLKYTCSTNGDATNTENRLGAHLAKMIEIKQITGEKTLQKIIPEYTDMRIDTLPNKSMVDKMNNLTDTSETFVENTVTTYCPLFFWFSEDKGSMLDTDFLQNLEISLMTQDSKEDMGLPVDLTDLDIELICYYVAREPVIFNTFQKKVMVSFDILQEPDQTVTGTTVSSYFTLQKNVFRTCACLVRERAYRAIKSFSIETLNYKLIDSDSQLNLVTNGWAPDSYENYSPGAQILSYNWSLENNYKDNSGSAYFGEMSPIKLDTTFSSVSSYTYKVFHLYWVLLEITEGGIIIKSDS